MSEQYHVLGVMSGSSMDGIDLAYCQFTQDKKNGWSFSILHAETVTFDLKWKQSLNSIPGLPATDILEQDISFGKYLGQTCRSFMEKYDLTPDFIASHGHTVFHQPEKGFTLQIGHGQAIASKAGVPVICDFRTKDIILGGQGAPLVPVGDEYLFGQYDICLNLGGIANLSLRQSGKRIAYDICPANQLLNHLSRQAGAPYDRGGEMASKGKLLPELFNAFNNIDYYHKTPPKSLGNEDIQRMFIPLLETVPGSVEDKLHTTSRHIAHQINLATGSHEPCKILVTGGGAFNTYLLDNIIGESPHDLIIPEKEIIEFKEALVFAFLGVLRLRNEINCFASVTGASSDSCTGVIYQP